VQNIDMPSTPPSTPPATRGATPGPAPRAPHRRRRDIQGLRALAVVAVVLEHVSGWPRGGFVGVDVFFVLSGFLITGLLVREHERTGRISMRGFYRRRVKRLLPSALVVLVVTLGAVAALLSASRLLSSAVDAVWSAVFVANWHEAAQGTDYFAADGPVSPFRHFWSLSVEEQFYVVWPLVVLLVAAVSARRLRGRARPG
jgi:peptidoglycan/LPS O-acetylase OafA/YrhL